MPSPAKPWAKPGVRPWARRRAPPAKPRRDIRNLSFIGENLDQGRRLHPRQLENGNQRGNQRSCDGHAESGASCGSRELPSVSRLVSKATPATPSVKAFSAAVTAKVRLKICIDSAFSVA